MPYFIFRSRYAAFKSRAPVEYPAYGRLHTVVIEADSIETVKETRPYKAFFESRERGLALDCQCGACESAFTTKHFDLTDNFRKVLKSQGYHLASEVDDDTMSLVLVHDKDGIDSYFLV